MNVRVWTLLLGLLVVPGSLWADGWPQFRGLGSRGISLDKNLPHEWGTERNVRWKVAIPGAGWSSPIVWGDKVFITTAVSTEPVAEGREGRREFGQRQGERGGRPQGQQRRPARGSGPEGRRQRYGGGRGGGPPTTVYRWEVYCLQLDTGDILWHQVAHEDRPRNRTHRSNTYASETPVTDGQRIYAYFGMVGLFCYDLSGKLLWKKDTGEYPMRSNWGTASSPVLHEDSIFLQIDHEAESFLLALDKKTGAEQWRLPREEGSNWSTPIIWKNSKRTELVTTGTVTRSYDPETGKLLWSLNMGGGRSSSSAAGDNDLLYLGTEERGRPGSDSSGGTLFAVKAGASGDVTPEPGVRASAGVSWSLPGAGPSMASPLVYEGYVYILDRRRGAVSCYDAQTGAIAYQDQRLDGARAFWASPWGNKGKIFCLDETGSVYVLAAGPEMKVLGRNTLSEKFWASPAMTSGAILLRGVNHVYCVAM